jgi:hypothetical protein
LNCKDNSLSLKLKAFWSKGYGIGDMRYEIWVMGYGLWVMNYEI